MTVGVIIIHFTITSYNINYILIYKLSELNIFTKWDEKLISDKTWPTGWLFYTHVEIKNGSNQKIIVLGKAAVL